MATVDGCDLLVKGPEGVEERHVFATAAEAGRRAAFVNEALSWIGTPFRDCADIKGPNGAVDCAMMLVRCAVDTGIAAPFDPRPYSPRHMLHSYDQKFIGWLEKLGAVEIDTPRVGDVVLWQFARSYSHGAIMVNSIEVAHAYGASRMALVSRRDEPLLKWLPLSGNVARPVKYFDLGMG